MKLKIITLLGLITLTVTFVVFGTNFHSEGAREKLLSRIIHTGLERWHYSDLKIDDNFSRKAFVEFMDYLDYSKRFFVGSDIVELRKYRDKIDDQFAEGSTELKDATTRLLKKRIEQVMAFYPELLSKPFDFNKKETLELDREKTTYAGNLLELKDRWRRILKYRTLSRYIALFESDKKDDKKKSDKNANDKVGDKGSDHVNKKVETLAYSGNKTAAERLKKERRSLLYKGKIDAKLEVKARKAVAKIFKSYFSRIFQAAQNDAVSRYFNSIVQVYDPHTTYFPPVDKTTFDMQMSGSFEGIGAQLQQQDEYVKVYSIIPGGPSWQQKELKAGDLILKVAQGDEESVDIIGMRTTDAVKLIRGKKGTTVRLTVRKPDGIEVMIPIVRDVVILEETFAKSAVVIHKKSRKRFGYIHLPGFYNDFSQAGGRTSAGDVKKELETLKSQKVEGVILDLRSNGGGSLQDAVRMSGLFIPEGPIVQVKDKRSKVKVLEDPDPGVTYDGPLIVLVNTMSASASEILSAALQDYSRAIIVGGSHSYGKGTVQAMVNLDRFVSGSGGAEKSFGALTITIQKFYRINGTSIQLRGVTPDIVLPDRYDALEIGEKHLDYSLSWDKVPSASYNRWKANQTATGQLAAKSAARVKINKSFQLVADYVKSVKKMKADTLQSLQLKEIVKQQDKVRAERKKLTASQMDVSLFDVGQSKQLAKKKSDQLNKLAKDRQKLWFKNMKKDLILGEAIEILNDMLHI